MVHLTKKQIFDAIKQSASVDSSFIDGWWICNDDNTAFLPLLQVARIVYGDKFPDFITFFNFSYKTALQVSVAAFFSLIWVTHGNFVSSCYVCA